MKKNLFALLLLMNLHCFSQWAPLNSTTTNDLLDVDFLDQNYGVIVGDNATILLTTNGGANWSDIKGNINSLTNIKSVKVLNIDTICVTSFDSDLYTGEIYKTVNGGLSWNIIFSDNGMNHKIDIETNMSDSIFAAGKNLYTNHSGLQWDTLAQNIAGTKSLSSLRFYNNQFGQLSGLISGFFNYSAYFLRTETFGELWHPCDPFSFPNADALSTMCFTDGDTAFVFTNHYVSWAPSNQNGLIKIYGFNKLSSAPGDTAFAFTSQIINSVMPDYMNSAYFKNRNEGYAIGNSGNVFVTTNSGINWTVDYTGCGGCSLYEVDFANNVGYAVGKTGTLIKYNLATGNKEIVETNKIDLSVYPNPAINKLTVRNNSAKYKNTSVSITIQDLVGQTLYTSVTTNSEAEINVEFLKAGTYFITYQEENSQPISVKWVKAGK